MCSVLAEHEVHVLHPADGSPDQIMDRAAEGSVGDPGNADDAIIIEDDGSIQDVEPQVIQAPLAFPAPGRETCRLKWLLQPLSLADCLCVGCTTHISMLFNACLVHDSPGDLVPMPLQHQSLTPCSPSIMSSIGTPSARPPC